MSVLITSNGSTINNGYLHLTTDVRTYSELASGPLSSTVLHTGGTNMLEVTKGTTISLAGGTDITVGATWLGGDYCRSARTIPGVTLSGDPATFRLMYGGQVVYDLYSLSGSYIYDPVSLNGGSGSGYPLYILEAGSTNQLFTGNQYGCGLGLAYYAGAWTPVVTFCTTNSTAATMWNNRASVKITLFITNGLVDSGSNLSINPVYSGYDVSMGAADIKVNNVSIFNRYIIASSYLGQFYPNNTPMRPLFGMTYDSFTVYNRGKSGDSKESIAAVQIGKTYIAGITASSTYAQYIGGDTTLRYQTIVMLNKGGSYTLPTGGSCFAVLCSYGTDQPGMSFKKIHQAMGDGNYYMYMMYLKANSSILQGSVWLTKSGGTLTLNATATSARCALVVYNG